MKSLAHRLTEEITACMEAPAAVGKMDQAIQTTQELLEQLYILRYKKYEENNNPVPEAVEIPEFDLASPPETEVPVQNTALKVDLFADIEIPMETEQSNPEESLVPTQEEARVEEESEISAENLIEESDSNDRDFELDLTILIHEAKGKHEKLDQLNGNYSLKEKISYINELFSGSSESFASAVKLIDSIQATDLPSTLDAMAKKNSWHQSDSEIIQSFIAKVVARYA